MTTGPNVTLRRTVSEDLEIFFTFQLDKNANYLAAFTAKDPTDKPAYLQKYTRFLSDRTINMMTVVVDDIVAGSIAKFELDGDAELTYWIDRKFWGKGVGTGALKNFLTIEKARPIFARIAFDNFGSRRVLEKCGFAKIGAGKGFANARQTEVEEYIYRLI